MRESKIEEAHATAKKAVMSYLPISVKPVFENILKQSSFDSIREVDSVKLAYHCLAVGMLHGLYSGLSAGLAIKDGSELERTQENIDIERDAVMTAIELIARDSQPTQRQIQEHRCDQIVKGLNKFFEDQAKPNG